MQIQLKQPEFNDKRSKRYNAAMGLYPSARINELKVFKIDKKSAVNPKVILEIGAGGGYLTEYLSKQYPNAQILAIDASKDMTRSLKQSNKIKILKNSKSDNIKLIDNSVDLVFSLASFHHITNKKQVFNEISRVLKPDGILFIGDVNDNTKTQKFFDAVVKKHCITSHDLDFLDSYWVSYLAKSSGLSQIKSKVISTPWSFQNKKQMLFFIKNLFGLKISYFKLNRFLEQIFNYNEKGGEIIIPWQLGYHILKKNGSN